MAAPPRALVPSWLQRAEEQDITDQAHGLCQAIRSCHVPPVLCRLAAEFAGQVCASATPFDGRTHAVEFPWAYCTHCAKMLCSARCIKYHCGASSHVLCGPCLQAHRNAKCHACHAYVPDCVSCQIHVRCERKAHSFPICSTCAAARGVPRVHTCTQCDTLICRCCVALHMEYNHPRKRKSETQ